MTHPLIIQCRYCGIISSLGLIELVKIFHQHTVNHGFALRVLRLVLSTLPRLLLDAPDDAMEDDDGDGFGGMGGIRREGEGDELDFSEDDDDEFDSDYDEEEEWEEDDEDMEEEVDGTAGVAVEGMGDHHGEWNTKKSKTQQKAMKNVFAPAEMYLSDVLDRNIGDDNGRYRWHTDSLPSPPTCLFFNFSLISCTLSHLHVPILTPLP